MRPQTWRMISLDVTPSDSSPSMRISMFLPLVWGKVYYLLNWIGYSSGLIGQLIGYLVGWLVG